MDKSARQDTSNIPRSVDSTVYADRRRGRPDSGKAEPSSLFEGHEDRISFASLPDVVHEKILSKLPFKELFTTGVVSRRWSANCDQVLRDISTLAIGRGNDWNLQSLCPVQNHSFKPLTYVKLNVSKNIDVICNLLPRMPKLVAFYMNFDCGQVRRADAIKLLEVLSNCPLLEHLEMPYLKMPKFDFSKFSNLSCVDHLQFADCPNLKYASVTEMMVSDNYSDEFQEDQIRQNHQLASLVPKLKWFECYFDDNVNQKLQTVILNGTDLEKLEIHIGYEADGELSLICENLKNLRILRVEGALEEFFGLQNLPQLESLRLDVSDFPIPAEHVRQILQPIGHRLKRLDLGRNFFRALTLETIVAIVETCPNLEVLDLGPDFIQKGHYDLYALDSIGTLSKLKCLEINKINCSEDQLVTLLKKLPSLMYFKGSVDEDEEIRKTSPQMFDRIRLEFPRIMFCVEGGYEDPGMKFVKSFYDYV